MHSTDDTHSYTTMAPSGLSSSIKTVSIHVFSASTVRRLNKLIPTRPWHPPSSLPCEQFVFMSLVLALCEGLTGSFAHGHGTPSQFFLYKHVVISSGIIHTAFASSLPFSNSALPVLFLHKQLVHASDGGRKKKEEEMLKNK